MLQKAPVAFDLLGWGLDLAAGGLGLLGALFRGSGGFEVEDLLVGLHGVLVGVLEFDDSSRLLWLLFACVAAVRRDQLCSLHGLLRRRLREELASRRRCFQDGLRLLLLDRGGALVMHGLGDFAFMELLDALTSVLKS